MIAHVGGVPLEEMLPSITGAGAGLLLARAWLSLHLRRRPEPVLDHTATVSPGGAGRAGRDCDHGPRR